jgi:hypothetical protein
VTASSTAWFEKISLYFIVFLGFLKLMPLLIVYRLCVYRRGAGAEGSIFTPIVLIFIADCIFE